MSNNLYAIVNGAVLELTTPKVKPQIADRKQKPLLYMENHNCGKLLKLFITINACGDEILSNEKRLEVMKNILTQETITNIPKINSVYRAISPIMIVDEDDKIISSLESTQNCTFIDEINLLPVSDDDSLNYVHNMVFKSTLKLEIPRNSGFGITRPKYGDQRILKILNFTIIGDSAPEEEAGRYQYYHRPNIIKKYKDAPCKQPLNDKHVRYNDMLFLDPYHRLPLNLYQYAHNCCCERTVSDRALQLREEYQKLPSINEGIDSSHVTFFDAISSGVSIDLSDILTNNVKNVEIEFNVVMDNIIEVSSKESINEILLDNYDILYPPVVPEEDEPEVPDDTGDNGEILPTPGTGDNSGDGENDNTDTNEENTDVNP